MKTVWSYLAFLAGFGCAGNFVAAAPTRPVPFPPSQGRTNLAAGRPVLFAPAPNYGLTAKGGTDSSDLTDGRFTRRKDLRMWFESSAVGWSYPGRVNLAVDLGRACRIEEIAVRFLGGAPAHGVSFPGWVEAFVSTDGEHYRKVGEFSRWDPTAFQRFAVPDEAGRAWVHCLRFQNLEARGRWVGLRFYGSALTCSDELYVFGAPAAGRSARPDRSGGAPSGFTVRHPQPYFHKPYIPVIRGLSAPVPIGLVLPAGPSKIRNFEVDLSLGPGLRLTAGHLGKFVFSPKAGTREYRIPGLKASRSAKTWGRLYLEADPTAPEHGLSIRWRFSEGRWTGPWLRVPVRVETVAPAPRLHELLTCLGWWSAKSSLEWPNVLRAWRILGLNGFPLFSHWMPKSLNAPEWRLLERARNQGFRIVNIDSPFHRMLARHKNQSEIYCQFKDGSHGARLCPSYRGRFYREEIARLARECARVRPDYMSLDIELWSWRGPVDSRKCRRCRADFAKSGLHDWSKWQEQKGFEMWTDLIGAAQRAVRAAGGRSMDVGGYDFRPGQAYQHTWPFDRLYPKFMMESQVSTYTCLYPYHLEVIGNEVRKDRGKLPRSDVLPWMTPGDAGTFPGEAFQWALLECFCNGARGIYFWSGRVWDAELLAAYNRVIRAIAPAEKIIVGGRLIRAADAAVAAPVRLSGLRLGDRMVLLAADYFRRTAGPVQLRLHLSVPSAITDLLANKMLPKGSRLPAGAVSVPLDFSRSRARLLLVRPSAIPGR